MAMDDWQSMVTLPFEPMWFDCIRLMPQHVERPMPLSWHSLVDRWLEPLPQLLMNSMSMMNGLNRHKPMVMVLIQNLTLSVQSNPVVTWSMKSDTAELAAVVRTAVQHSMIVDRSIVDSII